MKILIIYDSIFGNTEKIARAVAKSLESQNEVTFIRADAVRVERLVGLDVLIAGSPTRGFRPTSSMSGFLKLIPNGAVKGIKAAAFDTRMALGDMNSAALSVMVRIFGYAAQPIANQLEKKGAELLLPPEGFFVQESEGPLKVGELERAEEWGKQISLA